MSNLPIKDVKSCFLSNMSAVTKSQTAPGTESFSNVFQKSQKGQEQEISNTSLSNKGKSEKTEGDAYRDSMESSRACERLNKKTEDVMSTSKKQSAQEAAEEAGMTMVEKTAETFGVSVEEVEAVMELLGLTALDLLNPENLTGLVLALNPEVDALSLVTDEQLFMELKPVFENLYCKRKHKQTCIDCNKHKADISCDHIKQVCICKQRYRFIVIFQHDEIHRRFDCTEQ